MAIDNRTSTHETVVKETMQRRSKQGKVMVDTSTKASGGSTQQRDAASPVVPSSTISHSSEEHLPPILLTLVIFACSCIVLILCLRDFLMTGRNMFGHNDEMYMTFTKSTSWFTAVKGWKSTQGGFSAIQHISTDANNMGGFLVRKLAGGAGCVVQLHKIIPLVFLHEPHAQWLLGHYQHILVPSILANLAIVLFFASYWDHLTSARAQYIPLLAISALVIETIVMFAYYIMVRMITKRRLPAIAMPAGKTPNSFVSNITTRTTCIITTVITILASRDLFFSGIIIDIIPRDDIYLEWTNALLHSPPRNSPESIDHGMVSPLYIGDKFIAQLGALYILILCMYKYISTIGIRYGNDGSGLIKARMIWKVSCIGDAAMLLCFRLFAHAAKSASYDTHCHLVVLSYEAIIFGLYGYF